LDADFDAARMRESLRLAVRASERGEVPVGALVVKNGKVIGRGYNAPISSKDPSAHAEIQALREATKKLGNYRLEGCSLYVTLEPCAMCAGAIYWGNVRHVVFGLSQEQIHSISNRNPDNMQLAISSREIFERGDHPVDVSGPHLPRESSAVHEGFWD